MKERRQKKKKLEKAPKKKNTYYFFYFANKILQKMFVLSILFLAFAIHPSSVCFYFFLFFFLHGVVYMLKGSQRIKTDSNAKY